MNHACLTALIFQAKDIRGFARSKRYLRVQGHARHRSRLCAAGAARPHDGAFSHVWPAQPKSGAAAGTWRGPGPILGMTAHCCPAASPPDAAVPHSDHDPSAYGPAGVAVGSSEMKEQNSASAAAPEAVRSAAVSGATSEGSGKHSAEAAAGTGASYQEYQVYQGVLQCAVGWRPPAEARDAEALLAEALPSLPEVPPGLLAASGMQSRPRRSCPRDSALPSGWKL